MTKEENTKKETTKKTEVKKKTPAKTTSKSVQKNTSVKKTAVKKDSNNKTKAKTTPTTKKTIVQEENHYGRTLLAALLIVIVCIGGYLIVDYKKKNNSSENNYVATADEKAFKEEYESLNGTTRSNGQINKDIKIMDDNNIVYISVKEAAEILDSGNGIIYFGFAACPWCRNSTPILLNAMNSSELDKIYYVNVRPDDDTSKDIRDTYTLNSKDKAKKTKEAEDAYYNILLALANDLDDYVLTTESGKQVNTGEKRLAAPTVVAVKDGVVVGFHQGTVNNHQKDEEGKLRDLTKEEEVELLNTYTSIISRYLNSDCDKDSEGC